MKEKKTLDIIKVGGRVLENESARKQLIKTFADLATPKILVHGGGAQANQLCEKLGIPVRMHEGRRITDAQTLEVATMVYAGLVNKALVADLQACGVDALGLTGADGNSLLAGKRKKGQIDYGFAGDVKQVNTVLLNQLLNLGMSLVFCSVTHDGSGQLLNTNADTIAAELARGMSQFFRVRLWYCMEEVGVLDKEGQPITLLKKAEYQDLKAQKVIWGGMIPKLDNAFSVATPEHIQVFISGVSQLMTNQGTEVLNP